MSETDEGARAATTSRRRLLRNAALGGTAAGALMLLRPHAARAASTGDSFNVTAYGAVGDGVTDDTAAIQSAIDAASAAGGGWVFFPQGRYRVTAQGSGVALTVARGVTLGGCGGASTIALGSTGAYSAVIGNPGADLSGLQVEDLAIDLNGTANTTVPTAAAAKSAIAVDAGARICVQRCHVTNVGDTLSVIRLNGDNGTGRSQLVQALVAGNVIDGTGLGSTSHDHASVYVAATESSVLDNVFSARSAGLAGAVCAIEARGSRLRVAGNVVTGYAIGTRLASSVSFAAPTAAAEQLTAAGNQVDGAAVGVMLISADPAGRGTGLSCVEVDGNEIGLAPDTWSGVAPVAGVALQGTAPSRAVTVAGNTVRYATTTTTATGPADAGVSWVRAGGGTDADVRITGNLVESCAAAGILVDADVAHLDVVDNHVVDPWSSATTSPGAGIRVTSPAGLAGVRVNRNTIVDTAGRMTAAIDTTTSSSATWTDCEAFDNLMRTPARGTPAELPAITPSSAAGQAFTVRARAGYWTSPPGPCRFGSMITVEGAPDQAAVYVQTAAGAGATWQTLSYA